MTLANMTKEETNKANREHCKHIADTLENVAIGCLYKCSECGELVDVICYHTSDERLSSLVRAHQLEDARPCSWHGGFHLRKLSAREANRLAREMLGYRKYERIPSGCKITFINPHTWSSSVFAHSFELVRG